MKKLTDYKTILWDFDGVLIDSMPVRDLGFSTVLATYPSDQVEALMFYHRKNGGLSRYVKFRYFFETIRGEQISEEKIKELANSFSVVMLDLLVNPKLLIKDSLDFVRKYYRQIPMHIVSGSDGKELSTLCKLLSIADYFKSIHGSPIPKKMLVRQVKTDNEYASDDAVLIGDSINDYEAALENGIEFIGYNSHELRRKFPDNYISAFENIDNYE